MTSWQVRLAAALVWLGVLPGAGCLYLAGKAFRKTDDMLLLVMPIIASAALVAGVVVVGGAVGLAVRLHHSHHAARLQTVTAGACLAFCGTLTTVASPGAGLLLIGYGGLLVVLMCSAAAARDLGPWRRAVQQPSAPAHRTLPWLAWQDHSGPRAPWWQTWQAGLAQGIPLWELVLLLLALLAFVVGLVAVPLAMGGSHLLGTLHLKDGAAGRFLLLIPVSIAVVAWLERRMRERFATGSRR